MDTEGPLVAVLAGNVWLLGARADTGVVFLYALCGAHDRLDPSAHASSNAAAATMAVARPADGATRRVDDFDNLSHIIRSGVCAADLGEAFRPDVAAGRHPGAARANQWASSRDRTIWPRA